MTPALSFLDTLQHAADAAARAEENFRREVAERAILFERERAYAHRRLNFMRALAEAVAGAESEEAAVAAATETLCAKLGWASDSEARTQVLEHLAPVAREAFASLAPAGETPRRPDVLGALAKFEKWYGETHANPFWYLFEHYMPETPVVDF
jgi:hypothetical protein